MKTGPSQSRGRHAKTQPGQRWWLQNLQKARVAGAGRGAGLGLAFYTRLRRQIGSANDWEGTWESRAPLTQLPTETHWDPPVQQG